MTSTPNLTEYDVILVASSAGKDSQAMLDYVAELAREAGVMDRVVVLHNDLGEVEWPGTAELAQEQAEHYGFRYEMRHREQGLLLDQIRARHYKLRAKGDTTTPAWPSSAARYCTSDQKRAPARKLITQLVDELGIEWTGRPSRPVRQAKVLYCLGIRAQESSGRKKKPALELDKAATSGVREVTTWHPILSWTEDQVWARIHASGVRYHWAYDKGMKRLSCSFCVLASREDLACAARLRPDMARKYLELEQEIGHTFKADLSMAQIVAEAADNAA
ncbi:phosphoadenosine phosphosulfate reductase family protein [Streptomyces scabiei]|uniref:phosphoadenosine phosphosulfate reductase family protein n=1 Tax=Streptomyces scabiei TaxID=1930 RepID=UPI0029B8025E|nr:phosphoadenosine phosphosulfate reductase family protein [Streptomyces scabiei]MDX2658314.1 phosphoadenosine phosphosulfate reductase family protein [Streptomyces scabiei]MDX2870599.1 phosphoadenosine phosphosulfate reductase family protein [Streptomyces scabiei]